MGTGDPVKACSRCGVTKPDTDEHYGYVHQKRRPGQLRPDCRDCTRAYKRDYDERNRSEKNSKAAAYRGENGALLSAKQGDYYRRNTERLRGYHRAHSLKHEYGLSLEQYDAILESQGGVCMICSGTTKGRLMVDHCHETGAVRGLLCSGCNTALGLFGDNEAGLLRAVGYLRSAESRMSEVMPEGPAFEPRSRRYAREEQAS